MDTADIMKGNSEHAPYIPSIYLPDKVVDTPIVMIEDHHLLQRLDRTLGSVALAGLGQLIGMFSKEEVIENARRYCVENGVPMVMFVHRGTPLVYINDASLSHNLRQLDFKILRKADGDALASAIGREASIAIDDNYEGWQVASEVVRQLARVTEKTQLLIQKYAFQIRDQILNSAPVINVLGVIGTNISHIVNEIAVGEEMQEGDMAIIEDYSKRIVNALTYAQLHPDENPELWKGYEGLVTSREQLKAMFAGYIRQLFDTELNGDQKEEIGKIKDQTKQQTVIARQVTQVMGSTVEGQNPREFNYVLELLVQNLIVAILAGTHTTVNALTITLKHLHEGQKDIVDELMEKLGGNLDDSEVFFQALFDGELPKLYCFLMEALRLDASVVHKTIRYADMDILTPAGKIPAGVHIVLPIQGHGHNPHVWVDPEKFEPSRFYELMNGFKSTIRDEGVVKHAPFETGPRGCPGWKLAMAEMAYTIAALALGLQKEGKTLRMGALSIVAANVRQAAAALGVRVGVGTQES